LKNQTDAGIKRTAIRRQINCCREFRIRSEGY